MGELQEKNNECNLVHGALVYFITVMFDIS